MIVSFYLFRLKTILLCYNFLCQEPCPSSTGSVDQTFNEDFFLITTHPPVSVLMICHGNLLPLAGTVPPAPRFLKPGSIPPSFSLCFHSLVPLGTPAPSSALLPTEEVVS